MIAARVLARSLKAEIARRFVPAAALFLVLGAGGAPAAAPPGKAASAVLTYANVRFDYAVDYPGDLLSAGEEAANSDGLRFAPRVGDADVAVWGAYNALEQSPAQLLRQARRDCAGKPSYEVSKPALVALSCLTRRGKILYRKTIIREDTLATVYLEYAADEQARWKPVVDLMAGSLRLGPGPEYGRR